MTGLSCYVVSYDIRDDKRLRKVYRTMKEYGIRLHYSVFRCDLTKLDLARLKGKLEGIINHDQDRIMIIDLGPVKEGIGQRLMFIGVRPEEDPVQEAIF
ncbi:MAG: CRISPR-associated endonuclease Cas2 [Euryarchaeota archaeon]|jgi:CRISPR-associated protein Cas2|nr:CRISPR-associated endonuclease Cas2 [Euryarchaeota archaeon]